MADKQLINALADTGIPYEDAEDMVDRVFSAMRDLLVAGKTVGIPDVGRLRAPLKPAFVPGSLDRKAVEQRKVSFFNPAIVWKGEAYDLAKPIDPQVASYEMGQAVRAARDGRP